MMATDSLGIYVHIPFCVRKCNYCDFCSFALDEELKSQYVKSLIREISELEIKKTRCNSIFFGGGTPSLLSWREFTEICAALRSHFLFDSDLEFTVESNPGTLDMDKLKAFYENGVNRISIGMQSASDEELKTLGRIHNYSEFCRSYEMVRTAGFKNVNVDIMYGLPGQGLGSFSKTLEAVSALSTEHVSCYGLIVEDETPFGKNKENLCLPSEEEEYNMYIEACGRFGSLGYKHYEISNYAKPGFESVHNLKYWNCEPYLGFGVAAHSMYDGKRMSNTSNIKEYIEAEHHHFEAQKEITDAEKEFEYIMLRMRLADGLSLSRYRDLFAHEFDRGKLEYLRSLADSGFVKFNNDTVSFTEKGFYVSNTILCELV